MSGESSFSIKKLDTTISSSNHIHVHREDNFTDLISSFVNTPSRSISSSSGNMPSKFCWTYSAIVDLLCNKNQRVKKMLFYVLSSSTMDLHCTMCKFCFRSEHRWQVYAFRVMLYEVEIVDKESREPNDCWRTGTSGRPRWDNILRRGYVYTWMSFFRR